MNGVGDMGATATKADYQKPKNLIRSQYKDIMVKVDEDTYFLDRFYLALKSGYFEKLFTNDFADKYCDVIEIPVMDSDTFSAIVDIIYEAKLDSVINSNNYVSVLIAMDYLQMEVDLPTFENTIRLSDEPALNTDWPRLCRYITFSGNFQNLLPAVYECISKHLAEIREENLDEFLSLSFDHFIRIILSRSTSTTIYNRILRSMPTIDQRACSKLCAKWICRDLEKRLSHIIDLVNAAKVRFRLPNEINADDSSVRLPTIDEHPSEETLSRYFYKLMTYAGEMTATTSVSIKLKLEDKPDVVNDEMRSIPLNAVFDFDFDSEYVFAPKRTLEAGSKLEAFLKNGNFYDVIVKAGGKSYKLHRPILKSASRYFEEIFSAEYSEAAAQCEGVPALPNKDKEYLLDEIDQTMFDIIIDYIYFGKAKITSDIVLPLFVAADILKIDSLLQQCKIWLKNNSEKFSTEDGIKILNYAHENTRHKDLNEVYLTEYIRNCWPEMDNLPQFAELFKAFVVPDDTTDRSDKNKVSLLDKIERETFVSVVGHIHQFGEKETNLSVNTSNVVEVLKASEIFKMEDVKIRCKNLLTDISKNKLPSYFNLIEVLLRFTSSRIEYENINRIYFVKYLTEWPQVDSSLFGSISQDLLEDVLMSPDFYLDDPHEILDMCSKWIIHDVENRYRLLPEIAFAISQNRLANCNDHVVTRLPDLNLCTEDFVKEKLQKILSSTSVLPSEMFSTNKKKKAKTEQPVFITSTKNNTLEIFDSDMNVIESLGHLSECIDRCEKPFCISATKINDNIFILLNSGEKTVFNAYNNSLKKTFFLTSDSRMLNYGFDDENRFILLNCCNEIYCCFNNGAMLKYVFELNRWMMVSKHDPNAYRFCFTSEGSTLFRIRMEQTYGGTNNILESYNFDQNSWESLSNAPPLKLSGFDNDSDSDSDRYYDEYDSDSDGYDDSFEYPLLSNLIVVNNHNLAVLCNNKTLILFNRRDQTWKIMNSDPFSPLSPKKRRRWVPYNEDHSVITRDKTGGILYVLNRDLYRIRLPGPKSELRKKLPKKKTHLAFNSPYKNIIAVHDI